MVYGQGRRKMKYAASLLAGKDGSKGFIVTGRIYEMLRRDWKQSPEHIENKAKALRGLTRTKEQKKRMSIAAKKRGQTYETCHCGTTIDIGNYTKYHGENCGKTGLWPIGKEQKAKISRANKGRVLPKKKCPHCDKMVDGGNHVRWHGDNCKQK